MSPPATLRILCLGDSYTIGEGVTTAEAWPAKLSRMLAETGRRIDQPEVIATTGWTTDELEAALDSRRPHGAFDLVTLLIGANDHYRGRSSEVFASGYTRLVEKAVALAGARANRVVAISIPDWGVTPFATGRDQAEVAAGIDEFNARAARIATQAGCRWVDVTTESRMHPQDVVGDGLHPSAAAYDRWTALVLPTAVAALESR